MMRAASRHWKAYRLSVIASGIADANGDAADIAQDYDRGEFDGIKHPSELVASSFLDCLLAINNADFFENATVCALLHCKWDTYGKLNVFKSMAWYLLGLSLLIVVSVMLGNTETDVPAFISAFYSSNNCRTLLLMFLFLILQQSAIVLFNEIRQFWLCRTPASTRTTCALCSM